MGKAYMGGGHSANATLLGKHPPTWYERAQPPIPGWLNGDFRAGHIINQQKLTQYEQNGEGTIFTVDGFRIQTIGGIIKLAVGDGVTVTSDTPGAALVQGMQLFESAGKKITLSAEFAEITGDWYLWCNIHGTSGAILKTYDLRGLTSPGIYSLDITIPEGATLAYFGVAYNSGQTGEKSVRIMRMKPEYGDHFTGWYEIDPGEELVKCRRQYVRWGPYEKAGLALAYTATNATGYILLPQMRARPVVRYSNLSLSTDSHVVTGVTLGASSPSLIELAITSNVTSGVTYNIRVSAGGYLELDARL